MKTKDIGIRSEQVSMAMTKKIMDILTIIPRGKIATKRVPFVRSILQTNLGEEDLDKWGKLWMYFNSYWMSSMAFVPI